MQNTEQSCMAMVTVIPVNTEHSCNGLGYHNTSGYNT